MLFKFGFIFLEQILMERMGPKNLLSVRKNQLGNQLFFRIAMVGNFHEIITHI
jgi:hypothetical protein